MTLETLGVMVIKLYKRRIWCSEIHSILLQRYTYTTVKFDLLFNLRIKRKILIEMPSNRKQKAREKRSRQSDVLSDIENLNVMLCNYQASDHIRD